MSCQIIPALPRESKHLRLRLLQQSDLNEFHSYRSDPDVARLQGWSAMSEVDAEKFIHEQASVKALTPGLWSQIAIARRIDDSLVGDIGLWLSEDSSEAEFGLTIAPIFQGHGWGSESASEVVKLLFRNPTIKAVVAATDVRNGPCIGALKSAGLQVVGSREVIYKGELCREHLFRAERLDA